MNKNDKQIIILWLIAIDILSLFASVNLILEGYYSIGIATSCFFAIVSFILFFYLQNTETEENEE